MCGTTFCDSNYKALGELVLWGHKGSWPNIMKKAEMQCFTECMCVSVCEEGCGGSQWTRRRRKEFNNNFDW